MVKKLRNTNVEEVLEARPDLLLINRLLPLLWLILSISLLLLVFNMHSKGLASPCPQCE